MIPVYGLVSLLPSRLKYPPPPSLSHNAIGFDSSPSGLENPPLRWKFFILLPLGLHFLVAMATALVWLSPMNTEADKCMNGKREGERGKKQEGESTVDPLSTK